MKRVFFLIALTIVSINSQFAIAQLQGQARIDSLLKELPKAKQDTNHVNLLASLSFEYYSINPDKGIEYGKNGLQLAKKLSWKEGEAYCYNTLGANCDSKSDYSKALEYFHKALKINEEIDNKTGSAGNLGNIGTIFAKQSDYPKALEYFHKALKIFEELGIERSTAGTLHNIGVIYDYQSDYSKALEYFHKALKINEKSGENKTWLANNLVAIGGMYAIQSDYPQALEYFHKALKINEELGNKSGVANNLGNIGNIYREHSDYPKALEYYHKALKINEELGDKSGIADKLGNIGELCFKLSQDTVLSKVNEGTELVSLNKEINLNRSIEYFLSSIKLFEEIGELHFISNNYNKLSKVYTEKDDYKNAFQAFKTFKELQDSVFSMDRQKELANLDAKRENELKDAEIVILQTQKKAQQFQSYLLAGGVIVLFGAFGIAFLRFREKKKLSDKLAIQKNEIENQKSLVEEKNEQIVASITYASTIQHAILPWDSVLKSAFSDILIFYKPKDIVSGDSYWFKEVEGIKFLAAIDCTGHGIPGAMLTVIASSVLDDAVLGKRLTDTAEILTYMNEKVTDVLNQRLAENQTRDGMEVALIAIHQDKIQFTGAGRPLYMKNGTMEIIKTDKRGIAGSAKNDEYQFSSIEINKAENMTLFLTTDGFADQMNEHSKKYSTKRFVALLETISEKPITEQNTILENEFNNHRSSREQIDDVTILGVKI